MPAPSGCWLRFCGQDRRSPTAGADHGLAVRLCADRSFGSADEKRCDAGIDTRREKNFISPPVARGPAFKNNQSACAEIRCECPVSTQLSRSRRALLTAGVGHEDALPRSRLSARSRFSQRTFAGTRANGREAPVPEPPALMLGNEEVRSIQPFVALPAEIVFEEKGQFRQTAGHRHQLTSVRRVTPSHP
jgi:hypothetical protein